MILRMGLRGSDLQLTGVYLDHVAVERARRWTGEHFTVDRERGGMAGAHEGMGRVVPMIRASQVGAIGRESDHLAVGLLHHPGCGFLAEHLPAIYAVTLKSDFGGRARRQRGKVGSLNPLRFLA